MIKKYIEIERENNNENGKKKTNELNVYLHHHHHYLCHYNPNTKWKLYREVKFSVSKSKLLSTHTCM